MKNYQESETPSFQMLKAIYNGINDIYLPNEVESGIINTMADILVDHEGNFARCSNEMRNMFFHCSQNLSTQLNIQMGTIPMGYRLSLLWAKVCRLIYEGLVPYVALKQVCQQIERILHSIEPDHPMIISQESMCTLLLIWIEFHPQEPEDLVFPSKG